MLTLLLAVRTSSFGFIISNTFVFGSSIDLAGARISFSLFWIGSVIGPGRKNWNTTIIAIEIAIAKNKFFFD